MPPKNVSLIQKAASLPKGSPERKKILAVLASSQKKASMLVSKPRMMNRLAIMRRAPSDGGGESIVGVLKVNVGVKGGTIPIGPLKVQFDFDPDMGEYYVENLRVQGVTNQMVENLISAILRDVMLDSDEVEDLVGGM